mgnify:CR=1 FL=1
MVKAEFKFSPSGWLTSALKYKDNSACLSTFSNPIVRTHYIKSSRDIKSSRGCVPIVAKALRGAFTCIQNLTLVVSEMSRPSPK